MMNDYMDYMDYMDGEDWLSIPHHLAIDKSYADIAKARLTQSLMAMQEALQAAKDAGVSLDFTPKS